MKILTNNWIKALVINTALLLAIVLTIGPVYETNDDYGISLKILEGYPYVYLINCWLCKVLIPVQNLLVGVNVFICFQILASFMGFVAVTKLAFDYKGGITGKVITIACIVLYAGDHYCMVQYTKTSALLLAAGCIVLVDAVIRKRCLGYFILSGVLLFSGAALRFINVYPAVAFAGLFCVFVFISERKNIEWGEYFSKKMLILYGITIVMLGGIILSDYNSDNNDVVKEYAKYNSNRSKITDYPVYENYENFKEIYNDAGISENDLYMIRYWYQDENGSASLENMEKINSIHENNYESSVTIGEAAKTFIRDTAKEVRSFTRTGMHILLLVLLALAGMIKLKPKHRWYILALGLFSIAMYVYVHYGERTVYRATYSIDVNATLWLIYYKQMMSAKDAGPISRARRIAEICMAAIIALAVGLMMNPFYEKAGDTIDKSRSQLMPDNVTEYFNNHKNNFYIFSNGDKELSEYYLTPLRIPEKGFEINMICMGGWGTGSKFNHDKFGYYGLKEMYRDSIDNDRVFIVESRNIDRLTEYYNKWYGDSSYRIEFEFYKELDGYMLYQIKRIGK